MFDKLGMTWITRPNSGQIHRQSVSLCTLLLHFHNILGEVPSICASYGQADCHKVANDLYNEGEEEGTSSDSICTPSSDQDVCGVNDAFSSDHHIISYVCNIGDGYFSPVLVMEPNSCCTHNVSTKVEPRSTRPVHHGKHRVRRNFDRKTKERILNMYLLLMSKNPNMTVRFIAGTIFDQMRKDGYDLYILFHK